MLCGDPEACRRAIVENVHREALQADDLGEAVDDAGDMIECVREVAPRRHVRLAEARQVGRNDVEAIGQKRDEIPEHVARAREAMQLQQLRRAGPTSLPVEHLHPVDVGLAIFDRGHERVPLFLRAG
jgi:hypothetical protein